MGLHFDWCGGVIEDAIHLLNPRIKSPQIFTVLVSAVVAAGLGPLVNEIENHRRGDVHHAYITGKLIKPLQAVLFCVEGLFGEIDLAVSQILLGKRPERQVLTARRKFLLVVSLEGPFWIILS